jgi:hypothetical protein
MGIGIGPLIVYFSQLPLGAAYVTDGGCATVDAIYCINPVARPFFIIGAISNLVAGTCMLGAFGLGTVCPPAAFSLGGFGSALRQAGKYAVTTGNMLEPKPTLTKVTAPLRGIV